jgi:heavy metal translocating P-type ATPase
MNVMALSMALWTHAVYGPASDDTGPLASSLYGLLRHLCLVMALPVLLLLGGPLADSAWRALRRGFITSDLLLVLGVTASYVLSAISTVQNEGAVYFEVGCVVLVMVTLGRWLEATGKLKTTESIESLAKLLPDKVRIIRGDTEISVPLKEVAVGDHVSLRPGECVPIDGTIMRGLAAVDEHIVNGESSPVVKEPSDQVFAGTTNLDGDLVIEVTATARDGTISRLVELVRVACRTKGHYERLADRVAAWFTPAVVLLALATFGWHARSHDIERGILSGLAVLLIACPCALGLATPMAVWAALGRAAQSQVLFRNGQALEQLAGVHAIRLDKTGTLTTGVASVANLTTDDQTSRAVVLEHAAWLAGSSSHTLAAAIREFATPLARRHSDVTRHIRTLAGRGVVGQAPDESPVYLGSVRLMNEAGLEWPNQLQRAVSKGIQSGPLVCIGWDGRVRGVFMIREQLRDEALEAVTALRTARLDLGILTGDHAGRGAAIERELGVAVEAELLPEAKVAAITRAQRQWGSVAMVGDGINDAPALAQSDVGIAMGCGADVTRDSAAVCLLGNDLMRLPWAIQLARRTVRVIRRNLFWSFAYNIVGICLACSGRLNPALAALAMVLSSVCVVTNSLRLPADPQDAGTTIPDASRVSNEAVASTLSCT